MDSSRSVRASRVGSTLLACSLMLASSASAETPPAAGYPTIQSADANGATLLITGANFGIASTPIVKLGGLQLAVRSGSTATSIVATVPDSLGPGSYPLWVESFVSTPAGPQGLWSYIDLTLGAVGPIGPKGDKGDPGPAGVAGATGPQGPKGDKGDPGAVGAKGDTGNPGAVGPVGPQGPKGDTGAQGLIGPAGLQGPKGDTGLQGPPGSPGPAGPAGNDGAAGAVGPPGPKGDGFAFQNAWSPSAAYAPRDVVSDSGSAWVANTSNVGSRPSATSSDWSLLASKGDTGANGAAGAQGIAGPKGDTGPQGPPGADGAPGAAGSPGVAGPPGSKGDTGPQGPAGPQGPIGPQGPMGPAGGGADTGAERLTDGNPYLNLFAGNNSSGGIHLFRNDGNSWGYSYADANGIGVLNGAGNWAMRATGGANAVNTDVSFFTDGGSQRAFINSAGLTITGGDLKFTASNPTLQTGGSYLVIPNGAYFSGGTGYFQNQAQFRGGVNNDQGTLSLSGSNSVVDVEATTLQTRGHSAIEDDNDGWLRLNQQNQFANGLYTRYNLRVDGNLQALGTTSLAATSAQSVEANIFTARDQGASGFGDVFLGTQPGLLPGYPLQGFPVLGTHSANFYIVVGGTFTGYWSTSGYTQVSDERMKTDIRDLGASDYRETLASLDRIRSVNFRYKQEVEVARRRPSILPEAPMHIGVIAQSLPPMLVTEDANTGLGVKMGDMMGFLVASVRGVRAEATERSHDAEQQLSELRAQIQLLEQDNAQKQHSLDELRKRLERLETR